MLEGRPWLSQFDVDWYEYDENREKYPCISPVHLSEYWSCQVKANGKTWTHKASTLKEAVEFVSKTVKEHGTDQQKRALNV